MDETGSSIEGIPEMRLTVEFEEHDGATEIVLSSSFPQRLMDEQAKAGWEAALTALETHLAAD